MIDWSTSAIIAIVTLIITPFVYIWKTMTNRLDTLEKKIESKVDEQTVRNLLADKLEPIKDDVQSLDKKIDFLITFLMNKKND